MSHPLRPRRIAAYLAFLAVLVLLPYAAAQTAAALYVRKLVGDDLARYQQRFNSRIAQMQQALTSLEQTGTIGPYQLQLTDEEIRQFMGQLKAEIVQLQRQAATSPGISHSAFSAIVEAVITPLADSSKGVISWGGTAWAPYPAPAELCDYIVERRSGRPWIVGWRTQRPVLVTFRRAWPWAAAGFIALILFPFSLAMLPVSRRRAKVQWRHIWRVLAYSMCIPAILIPAATVCAAAGFADPDSAKVFRWLFWRIAVWGPWAFLIAWWSCAIGRYLRIPRGWFVAALLSCMLFWLILAAAWLTDESLALRMTAELFD